jgi:hypothetical protein
MPSSRPLLFLDFDGVLALSWKSKQPQLKKAIRSIALGSSVWGDHLELLGSLFDARAVSHLKDVHDQFDPEYCLISDIAEQMDRLMMITFLRVSALPFVARNLHARWQIARNKVDRSNAASVSNWLKINSESDQLWVMIDAQSDTSATDQWPRLIEHKVVVCCSDTGLTEAETARVYALFDKKSIGPPG